MRIAIASGKGGAGKTTVAVALAFAADGPVHLLDCDVEEPNAGLYVRPQWQGHAPGVIPVPAIDDSRCSACGACSALCQFNAIATLGGRAIAFPELCHGCGGCVRVCPTGAITETPLVVGEISWGQQGDITICQGRLDVGRAMAPPVIRAVLQRLPPPETLTIIDCPPGTSCPMVTAVRQADLVLLVSEPTPFGLHDLRLALETVRTLGRPFAVAINRCDSGDDRLETWLGEQGAPIAFRIPDSRPLAEACSRGASPLEAMPELGPPLRQWLRSVGPGASGRSS